MFLVGISGTDYDMTDQSFVQWGMALSHASANASVVVPFFLGKLDDHAVSETFRWDAVTCHSQSLKKRTAGKNPAPNRKDPLLRWDVYTIRSSPCGHLKEQELSVWLDFEQMIGNVYSKLQVAFLEVRDLKIATIAFQTIPLSRPPVIAAKIFAAFDQSVANFSLQIANDCNGTTWEGKYIIQV
ncbi:hypothetical protein BJ742DRAFT_865320 [Cladochytrium replicatum]|nr:hypothetical protein BJ742DRAFT_865320 [Cladochytrium replicatum]